MTDDHKWLALYLQDHYAGSVAGSALFHRVASSHGDPVVRGTVAELATQVDEDQRDLDAIMRVLKVPHSKPKESMTWVGEKVGRLNTNGSVLRRSPLTDVVELEVLSLAVEGKALGWKTLLRLAENEPRIDASQVQALLDRAQAQRTRLEELRIGAAAQVLAPGPTHSQIS